MRSWATTKTQHGTSSGYQLHMILGEDACDECRAGKRRYYATSKDTVRLHRLRQHAMEEALRRLGRRYPDERDAFYDEELRARGLDNESLHKEARRRRKESK